MNLTTPTSKRRYRYALLSVIIVVAGVLAVAFVLCIYHQTALPIQKSIAIKKEEVFWIEQSGISEQDLIQSAQDAHFDGDATIERENLNRQLAENYTAEKDKPYVTRMIRGKYFDIRPEDVGKIEKISLQQFKSDIHFLAEVRVASGQDREYIEIDKGSDFFMSEPLAKDRANSYYFDGIEMGKALLWKSFGERTFECIVMINPTWVIGECDGVIKGVFIGALSKDYKYALGDVDTQKRFQPGIIYDEESLKDFFAYAEWR
jgi:hypothetical protein